MEMNVNVYFRENGKLGAMKVDAVNDHRDAILAVKESLIDSGVGYNEPVLVLIKGGKQ